MRLSDIFIRGSLAACLAIVFCTLIAVLSPTTARGQTITAQTVSPGHGVYGPVLPEQRQQNEESANMRPVFDQPTFLERVEGATGTAVQPVSPTQFDRKRSTVTGGHSFSVEHRIFDGPVTFGYDGHRFGLQIGEPIP